MTDPNYELLLDEETKAFIKATQSYYPDRGQAPTIAEIRADYEAMCSGFAAPHPAGLSIHDSSLANGRHAIPVRWYRPEAATASQPVFPLIQGRFSDHMPRHTVLPMKYDYEFLVLKTIFTLALAEVKSYYVALQQL